MVTDFAVAAALLVGPASAVVSLLAERKRQCASAFLPDELMECIEEERYERAAEIRDLLKSIRNL